MAFSYDFEANPQVALVRALIPDTVDDPPTMPCKFSDREIMAFYQIQQMQFQSSMFFSGSAGRNLPLSPVSILRVAALALDALAGLAARSGGVTKLLDVSLQPMERNAIQLRAQAMQYRQVDDESGAFVIFEQCTTVWAFRNRFWAQVQRQTGGGA
jgi:hypothetical protein